MCWWGGIEGEGTAISLQRAQHGRHDQRGREWSLCVRCSEKYLTLTLILSGFDVDQEVDLLFQFDENIYHS